jgi:hypothetical protein
VHCKYGMEDLMAIFILRLEWATFLFLVLCIAEFEHG